MSEQDTFEAVAEKLLNRLYARDMDELLAAHHRAQVSLLEGVKEAARWGDYEAWDVYGPALMEAIDTELNRLKGDNHE